MKSRSAIPRGARLQAPYRALERALAKGSKQAVREALARLSEHEKDLLVECKTCGAAECVECIGQSRRSVHFGRRLARLLAFHGAAP